MQIQIHHSPPMKRPRPRGAFPLEYSATLPNSKASQQRIVAPATIASSEKGKCKKYLLRIIAKLSSLIFILVILSLVPKITQIATLYNKTSNDTLVSKKPSIISYKLIRGYQRNNTFDPYYICKADKFFGPRIATSPIFLQKGVLDFDTEISTSLKIIVLGDSVGIQFSQALQEAAGAQMPNRHVLKYSWRKHEGVHLAQPVRGGGAVAGYRITGMFTMKQKDNHFQLAPVPGGGWVQEHVDMLKNAMMNNSKISPSVITEPSLKNSADFDVLIMQFPYGWLERPKEQLFTHEIIMEAIHTSYTVFGVKTIILQTVPVQNNVENLHRELVTINNAISDFVKDYIPPKDGSGVQCVMLMDVAFLSLSLFVHNAVGLKLVSTSALDVLHKPISTREKERELVHYLNSTLAKRLNCCHPEYKEIVAFSCGESVADPSNTKYCQRNIYTNDGMHWCMVSRQSSMCYWNLFY
jgi:hypothetical protein